MLLDAHQTASDLLLLLHTFTFWSVFLELGKDINFEALLFVMGVETTAWDQLGISFAVLKLRMMLRCRGEKWPCARDQGCRDRFWHNDTVGRRTMDGLSPKVWSNG